MDLKSNLQEELLKTVLVEIPNVLTFIDKDIRSKTYGCCCYPFWKNELDPLINKPNFVNARWQELVLVLAYVFSYNYPGNNHYQSKELVPLIKAILMYWVKVQHADGSFSEWRNGGHEHAPTAFSLAVMAETFSLMQEYFNEDETNTIKRAMNNSVWWLFINPDLKLVNHEAGAINALCETNKILESKQIASWIDIMISRLQKGYEKEGWFYEFGAFDSGYNGVTLFHLGLAWEKLKDERLEEWIKAIMEFNKYFVYPDKLWGGGFNSRYSAKVNPLSYAMFLRYPEMFPLARPLFLLSLQSIFNRKLVKQHNLTDYHKCVMLGLYLRAYNRTRNIDIKEEEILKVPAFTKENFHKVFKKAAITAIKNPFYYAVIGYGATIGTLYSYKVKKTFIYAAPLSLNENKNTTFLSGVKIETKDGNILTSMDRNNSIMNVLKKNVYSCQGYLSRLISRKEKRSIYERGVSFITRFSYLAKLAKFCARTQVYEILKRTLGHKDKICFFERNLVFNDKAVIARNKLSKIKKDKTKSINVCETIFLPADIPVESIDVYSNGKVYTVSELMNRQIKSIVNIGFRFNGKEVVGIRGSKPTDLFFRVENPTSLIESKFKFANGIGLALEFDLTPFSQNSSKIEYDYEIGIY